MRRVIRTVRLPHLRCCATATDAGTHEFSHRHPDEELRWWPVDNRWSGRTKRGLYDSSKKTYQGMVVPEVKEVPKQGIPDNLSYHDDTFFTAPEMHMHMDTFDEERRFLPAPTFDPAIDDIEEQDYIDATTVREVQNAAEADKRRLEAFGNPLAAEDQMNMLLAPQREGQENKIQRDEFNGFLHWGLLKAADVAVDQEKDMKKAHSFVNRYLRDIDLFEQWLKHPKVVKHMQKKFQLDVSGHYDKLMGMVMALYMRSKIQTMETDYSGSLKSLVAAAGLINEAGKLDNHRYRKALGGILSARGMTYLRLSSAERAEDDLTRALTYMPAERCATVFQLRAEARELQGKIMEAREDEERAADIWEHGEVITPGMDHPPVKWVM